MCCLKYEQEVYEEKIKRLPKVGSIVKTEDGEGTVASVEVLKEVLRVQFKNDDVTTYKNYKASDVKLIKGSTAENDEIDNEEIENLEELKKLEELEKEDHKNQANQTEEDY